MTDALKTIQALVAPVVMISACGLLCLALYNRLAAIVSRARVFLKERFDAVTRLSALELDAQTSPDAHLLRSRIAVLDLQVPAIFARARLIRNAIVAMLAAVLCMLGCSITLGLSLVLSVAGLALVLFFVGVLAMAFAMVLAIRELASSLDPLALEHAQAEAV